MYIHKYGGAFDLMMLRHQAARAYHRKEFTLAQALYQWQVCPAMGSNSLEN
jgi:hypothetical protein